MVRKQTDRIVTPISNRELERRWGLVREQMRLAGIDALITRQADDWLGGYVKWFTDVPATNGYGTAVIFHADDLMTLVHAGAFGGKRALGGQDPQNRGVGEMISTSPFASAHFTSGYEAELISSELLRRGYRSVGLIARGFMPYDLVRHLEERCKGKIRFMDASNLVDPVKAIKSQEELDGLRATAAMQDKIFETVLNKIQPGMRDIDIMAAATHEGMVLGSEQGLFHGGSSPLGEPAVFRRRHFQGRTMEKGDHITVLIENNGPGGFYTELARTVVLGRATAELLDATETAMAIQSYNAEGLKPGRSCRDIFEAHNSFMKSHGLPPEDRLYSHGQGYDLVERPLVRFDEEMIIEGGMCLPIHPTIQTRSIFVNLCDNFIVHHDGSVENIHKTEKKVFEI